MIKEAKSPCYCKLVYCVRVRHVIYLSKQIKILKTRLRRRILKLDCCSCCHSWGLSCIMDAEMWFYKSWQQDFITFVSFCLCNIWMVGTSFLEVVIWRMCVMNLFKIKRVIGRLIWYLDGYLPIQAPFFIDNLKFCFSY